MAEPEQIRSFGHDPAVHAKADVHVEEVVVQRISEENLQKESAKALKFWSNTGLRIILIMFIQLCNQSGYGVDWAVIGGLNAFESWHDYFGFGTAGSTFATLNALMRIGTIAGSPFLALSDVIGRRGTMFVGNALTILAALLQGLATGMPMFMAGRFLLGFGSTLVASCTHNASQIAPVHLRGRLVGIMGATFHIGSIIMDAALIGFSQMPGNKAWRIPLLLEAIFPAIVVVLIYFTIPESPRYLVKKGKIQEAKKVIAKYQTTSQSTDEPIVGMVIAQIEESLESTRTGFKQSWNFAVFFTKVVRYRLLVLILYSAFQSWNGGGIVSYYLTPALETIGIHDEIPQLGINLGLVITYTVFTLLGSWIIDFWKRRTLIFSGLITIIAMQTCAIITSWRYNVSPSKTTAGLTILWMFMFQCFSATFIATMHNLYPVEVLSLNLRSKGMGLYGLIQGACGVVEAYGISIGIQKVGYKIWVVYIAYNTIQLGLSYFIFPETANLSLEEIDSIFETPGIQPVKMSL
ncbi:MFS general substrate transporter [Paraphaeosphaeria sporulosa]|uniref:MFS general substrate transporter n=1 Tax=Paraphaeosphaeria sporulosa TaxID=1460663 RepID=A0A177CGY2_9PLEO|nr:MFS general substrate transporter [Paraphaeosphaeria sporulosa]OAG06040.1 MFS general substrate transporter [Paraphaeosphaeria sporulosa]